MTELRRGAINLALPALILANVVLACGPWLVRLARSDAHVGPVGSAFWRLALAWPVLLTIRRMRGERSPARWGTSAAIAAIGGVLFAADLATWHFGILHTRLANSTLLGNVTAILFPTYGFIAARSRPTERQALALGLAAGGAILLVGRSYELSARNVGGDLLCIVAGICYTGYLIVVERLRDRMGQTTTLLWSMAAGIPVLLLAAFVLGDPIRPQAWAPLVLLALGSQVIGQSLVLFAVLRLAPLVVGVTLLVQPIVASGIGWIVYGERLTPFDAIGAVAIAMAVLLVREPAPLAGGRDERKQLTP